MFDENAVFAENNDLAEGVLKLDSVVRVDKVILEASGIQTRMLFAGNFIKHPCFDEMRKSGNGFRIVSSASPTGQSSTPPTLQPSGLLVTDRVMRDTFWVGVYPGLTREMLEYKIEKIREFVEGTRNEDKRMRQKEWGELNNANCQKRNKGQKQITND